MIISLEELGLAYRKAKVDLYYSSHVSLEAISVLRRVPTYESDGSAGKNTR